MFPGTARRPVLLSADMIDERFTRLLAARHGGVLATLRKDGRPQLSNVSYAWFPDEELIKVSVTDDRAKVANIRRDARVSFHVTSEDFWSYAVFDGIAELSPVAADPGDAAVDELVELYLAVAGEHPDWDDYRAAMVRDKRLVLRIRPNHVYGIVRDVG
jgi:PPOX class probable F420-dependent enzyme